jgi:uncharacterized membrane protein
MQAMWTSFGIGVVTGMRSMTACAALTWAASQGRTRGDWIPSSPIARGIGTALALGEIAGDKMAIAPDRRILPSYMARLAIGAAGGAALAGRDVSPTTGALLGAAGAFLGTSLGRRARGGRPHSPRGFAEDMVAAGLALTLIRLADPQGRPHID